MRCTQASIHPLTHSCDNCAHAQAQRPMGTQRYRNTHSSPKPFRQTAGHFQAPLNPSLHTHGHAEIGPESPNTSSYIYCQAHPQMHTLSQPLAQSLWDSSLLFCISVSCLPPSLCVSPFLCLHLSVCLILPLSFSPSLSPSCTVLSQDTCAHTVLHFPKLTDQQHDRDLSARRTLFAESG